MKVLITGGRKGSDTDPTAVYGLDTALEAVVVALKEAGHEVDHFPIKVGEDVSGYDLAIVMPCNPTVWGSQYFLGMLWTMVCCMRMGPPMAVLFKHWDIRTAIKGIESLVGKPDKIFEGFIEYDEREKARRLYQDEIMDMMDRLGDGQWPEILCCAWAWGDKSLLSKGTNLPPGEEWRCFDPTNVMYVPKYTRVEDHRRERVWVLGTYEDSWKWLDKQSFTGEWELEFYGLRNRGKSSRKERFAEKIPRDLLVKRYHEVWGGLSPVYYHSGSGYWRARFQHYADAGIVCLADPKEVSPMLSGFDSGINPYLVTAESVEGGSDKELRELADAQAAFFWERTTPRDACIETILGHCEDVARNGSWSGQHLETVPLGPKEVSLF